MTFLTDWVMVAASRLRRFSGWSDSRKRNDQIKTTVPRTAGTRKTTCHEEIAKIAVPRIGAMIGVKRKMVITRDMVRPILSPVKRSRTLVTALTDKAAVPNPATKRATKIKLRLGDKAAAIQPLI